MDRAVGRIARLVEVGASAARDRSGCTGAPNDVMLDLLEQLAGDPAQADMRYVLALLLVRRRVCRFVEGRGAEENRDVLVLFCPRREVEYRVRAIVPDKKRSQEIQNELARLLFAG